MKSLAFNIGGVPEHFNLPFRKAIDEGVFCAKNLDLNWKDYNGGTGDLVKALVEKQIDIGVLLTEGAVKAIADQNTLDSIDYISTYLEFSVTDMKQWIQKTDWNYLLDVPYPKLNIALDFLKEVNLVEVDFDINHLCPGENFWTKCSL